MLFLSAWKCKWGFCLW